MTQVGTIGNGDGDLYQPLDFALDARSWVYVQDAGNKRIVIYDAKGTYSGAFPVGAKPLGLAVNQRGEILLGQPQLGSLVTVYDAHGKKQRSLGTLVRPSEVYGPSFKRFDANTASFNRVRLATDDSGNVWVALQNMPLLYKFGPKGNLLLRKQLQYAELSPVLAAVGSDSASPDFAAMNIDGIQLTMVVRDVEWDARAKQLLVLLGNERTIVLDADGREVSGFRPADDHGNLQTVSARDGDGVFATIFGSPFVYRMETQRR